MSVLHRLFAAFVFLLLFSSARSKAESAPAFQGYLAFNAARTSLLVDGRPLLLSPATRYACDSLVATVHIKNGIPNMPEGTRVDVTGTWDKKAQAWRTEALCVVGFPPKSASGRGVIDQVLRAGSQVELVADGRHLLIPPGTKSGPALTFQPSLTGTDAPSPGSWIQYTADRQQDGSWLLRSGTVREYLDNSAARRLRKWQPVAFTPPAAGQDGSVKLSHVLPPIQLPGNAALQDRMARVGATVVPAWEKSFGARYPDERQMRFYAAALHGENCSALPNGIVLIPEKTADRLSEDAALAAFLAVCVAEIEEEQIAVIGGDVPGSDRDLVISGAEFTAFGLTGAAANAAYQKHLQTLFEQQSARVALTYLATAGYPLNAGPQLWEVLESRHGQPDLSRPPGPRTQDMYEALAENTVEAEAPAASMLK